MTRLLFVFIFLFSLFFSINIYSQPLKPKQLKLVKQTIAAQFGKVSEYVFLEMAPKTTCVIGRDTFFNPDGFYYLFQLKGDSAIRLDLSSFHGASYFRTLFAWQNKLYQLGGYGFFATHNNLIFFEKNIKEWLYQPTKGNTPLFINGITFLFKDKIYSFNNIKGGNNVEKNIVDSNLYVLDLKTMVWEKYDIPDKKMIIDVGYNQTKDFFWYHNQAYSVIVNKKELKYMIIDNKKVGCIICRDIDHQNENVIYFKWPSSSLIDSSHCIINFDSLWNAYHDLQKNVFTKKEEKTKTTQKQSNTAWIFMLLISLMAIGVFIWVKNKKKVVEVTNNELINEDAESQNTNIEIMYRKIIALNKDIIKYGRT